MKMKIKIIALLTAILMILSFSACSINSKEATSSKVSSQSLPTKDRQGNTIKVPSQINRIISASPQSTEILVGLGVTSKLVATDTFSADVSGISKDLPRIDFYNPDAEKILTYKPDVIIVGGMSQSQGTDPFKAIKDAGVCVVYIPTSNSLQGIMDDISFLAQLTGTTDKANTMIADMKTQIDKIKAIGSKITTKKKVYFEIDSSSTGPYSFGSGVFLDEILGDIGATNIFSNQKSWIKVSPEQVVALNPDVLLSNDMYTPNAIGVIKARAGWGNIAAIKNNQVFTIDTNSSSRPSQNIIKAMLQIAKAVYPDQYKDA
jgi:iron complex transport system substrate-binding protein